VPCLRAGLGIAGKWLGLAGIQGAPAVHRRFECSVAGSGGLGRSTEGSGQWSGWALPGNGLDGRGSLVAWPEFILSVRISPGTVRIWVLAVRILRSLDWISTWLSKRGASFPPIPSRSERVVTSACRLELCARHNGVASKRDSSEFDLRL
jgi:hypothetical protein